MPFVSNITTCTPTPWSEGDNESGYINLAVAQNFLTVDMVQDKFRARPV